MRPARALMFALPMSIKLAFLVSCLLGPLLLLMGFSLVELESQRRQTMAERRGVDVIEAIVPVFLELERCRGLTDRTSAGDAAAAGARDVARHALRTALTNADAVIAGPLPFAFGDMWPPVRQRVLELSNGAYPAAATGAQAAHSAAIEQLRQLVLLAWERSGLMLASDARAALAAGMLVHEVVATIELAGDARGTGAALLAPAPPDPQGAAALRQLGHRLAQLLHDTNHRMVAYERAGGHAPGAWARTRAVADAFVATMGRPVGAGTPLSPGAFFDAGTRVIESLQSVERDLLERARVHLDAKRGEIERTMGLRAGIFMLSILALGYLLAAFFVTFREALAALEIGAEAMAGGDLSHRFDVHGRDELSRIGSLLDRTGDRLSELVADIRSSASLVNLAGDQVAEGSQKLSQRTDSQAVALRQSATAIDQLSGAVTANADAARDLDHLTRQLSEQAVQGQGSMAETMEAMHRLKETSQRVTEIVTVIDDIAFQTGMLALNAAVEAARAGEAGNGFGVVAAEVRQLAQRCAESAEEIRGLIGAAAAQVDASADKLKHASDALDRIVGGVRVVSGRLGSISQASSQQSGDLAEVTRNVGSLDGITRENAALVEQSASASCALVDRAATLRGAVASMRLRRGSADEAHALVLRAVAHIDAVGREQAFADFHVADGGFIDRDLYVFAYDRNGIALIFGSTPALVGMPASAVPGLDSVGFLEQAWRAADAGGGWIQYEVVNPLSGTIQPKESFILPLGPSELIGCGAYRRDTTTARSAQAQTAAA